MLVITKELSIATQGNTQVLDLTPQVKSALQEAQLKQGTVTVFVPGSTAGVTTIEYEPGLVKDARDAFEQMLPEKGPYAHNRGGENNGHSHLRASLVGPSLTIPVLEGALCLGTWQQIVLLDFDTRPRRRSLVLQFIGE